MNIRKLWLLPITILAIGLVIGFAPTAYAQVVHPDTPLLDASGNPIAVGSNTPYSPKQTCNSPAAGCHTAADNMTKYGVSNFYEDGIGFAVKVQTGATYTVPYPLHGVTAGYHFQQGRNLSWGEHQKEYYHVQLFTSSGGMYGKY
jgi:hypothetical protein